MTIIDGKEQEYKDRYDKNRDGSYREAVFQFAEKWADLMEERIDKGVNLADIAHNMESKANEGIGITGFQYGCAISILSKYWVHGEELRKWHNIKTQIGSEGEKANARRVVCLIQHY